jgi:hypothetical protein
VAAAAKVFGISSTCRRALAPGSRPLAVSTGAARKSPVVCGRLHVADQNRQREDHDRQHHGEAQREIGVHGAGQGHLRNQHEPARLFRG